MKKLITVFLTAALLIANSAYAYEDVFGLTVEQKEGKLIVVAISDNSKTTLKINDVIVEVNGVGVKTLDEYKTFSNNKQSQYVNLRVISNGELVIRSAKNFIYEEASSQATTSTNNANTKARIEKNNEEAIIANSKVRCEKIGFKADTADYTNCVFKLYTYELDTKKPAIVQQNNTVEVQAKVIDEDAQRREKALLMMQYMNFNNKPIQLQPYQMQIRPSINTNCSTYGNQTNCTSR